MSFRDGHCPLLVLALSPPTRRLSRAAEGTSSAAGGLSASGGPQEAGRSCGGLPDLPNAAKPPPLRRWEPLSPWLGVGLEAEMALHHPRDRRGGDAHLAQVPR